MEIGELLPNGYWPWRLGMKKHETERPRELERHGQCSDDGYSLEGVFAFGPASPWSGCGRYQHSGSCQESGYGYGTGNPKGRCDFNGHGDK